MDNATKGILLSGLVCPGLGQIMLGRKVFGLTLISLACATLGYYAYGLIARMWTALSHFREMASNPAAAPENLLSVYIKIFTPASSMEVFAIAGLVGAWFISILHAYFVGRQLDRR